MNRFLRIFLLLSLFLLSWTGILWAEWYWGLIHVHSTYSDGKLTLSELRTEALERGYHFLMMSDHADRIPDNETFNNYVKECRALTTEEFAMIPGEEITVNYPHDLNQHILGLGLGYVQVGGNYWWQSSGQTQQEILKNFAKMGVFTVAAHPYTSDKWFWDLGSVQYLSAIEFFNFTETEGKEEEVLKIYLQLVKDYKDYKSTSYLVSSKANLPVVTAGNDSHASFIPPEGLDRAQTYIWADKVSWDDLLIGLKSGHSYASKGNCRIEEINYIPSITPYQVSSSPNLKFSIKYFRLPKSVSKEAYTVKIFRDGEEVFSQLWEEVKHPLDGKFPGEEEPWVVEFQDSEDLPEGLHIYNIYIQGELLTSPIVFEYKKSERKVEEPSKSQEPIEKCSNCQDQLVLLIYHPKYGDIVPYNNIYFFDPRDGTFRLVYQDNDSKSFLTFSNDKRKLVYYRPGTEKFSYWRPSWIKEVNLDEGSINCLYTPNSKAGLCKEYGMEDYDVIRNIKRDESDITDIKQINGRWKILEEEKLFDCVDILYWKYDKPKPAEVNCEDYTTFNSDYSEKIDWEECKKARQEAQENFEVAKRKWEEVREKKIAEILSNFSRGEKEEDFTKDLFVQIEPFTEYEERLFECESGGVYYNGTAQFPRFKGGLGNKIIFETDISSDRRRPVVMIGKGGVYSPDGKRIVFSRILSLPESEIKKLKEIDKKSETFFLNEDCVITGLFIKEIGGEEKQITFPSYFLYDHKVTEGKHSYIQKTYLVTRHHVQPKFSPNGKDIVFVEERKEPWRDKPAMITSEIYLYKNGQIEKIDEGINPVFSPDGKKIAFLSCCSWETPSYNWFLSRDYWCKKTAIKIYDLETKQVKTVGYTPDVIQLRWENLPLDLIKSSEVLKPSLSMFIYDGPFSKWEFKEEEPSIKPQPAQTYRYDHVPLYLEFRNVDGNRYRRLKLQVVSPSGKSYVTEFELDNKFYPLFYIKTNVWLLDSAEMHRYLRYIATYPEGKEKFPVLKEKGLWNFKVYLEGQLLSSLAFRY